MLREIRPAIFVLALLTLITGLAYPLAMTGIAGMLFPKQAQGSLVERGTSSGGSGVTTFTADPDGQTLRVLRRVESDQLSAPLQVTYTYRRKPGANSS